MNKFILFGVLSLILVFGILGSVYADKDKEDSIEVDGAISVDSSADLDDYEKKDKKDKEDDEEEFEEGIEYEEEIEYEEDSNGSKYTKKVKEEYTYKFRDGNGTEYEIEVRTQTRNNGNETEQKIKIKLSNGQDKEIKIMPETASQNAIDKLKSRNISVILKEVGEGNNLSVVYEAEGNKTVKFLGLFKVKAEIKAVVDSETGEVTEVDNPWWYFLAFGKNKIEDSSEDLNETVENETEVNETVVNGTFVNETINNETQNNETNLTA